jgi:hypothetical protein
VTLRLRIGQLSIRKIIYGITVMIALRSMIWRSTRKTWMSITREKEMKEHEIHGGIGAAFLHCAENSA